MVLLAPGVTTTPIVVSPTVCSVLTVLVLVLSLVTAPAFVLVVSVLCRVTSAPVLDTAPASVLLLLAGATTVVGVGTVLSTSVTPLEVVEVAVELTVN